MILAGSAWQYGGVHQSHAAAMGPEQWATLAADLSACSTNRAQLLPDLSDMESFQLTSDDFSVQWRPFAPVVKNTGATVDMITYGAGGAIIWDGDRYELAQLHFLRPSAHTVDGAHMPMEVHFVHRAETGALLVVGVLLTLGPANPVIAALRDLVPPAGSQLRHFKDFDPKSLLPKESRLFRHAGSVTTQPCAQGVTWLVFADSVPISSDQFGDFSALFINNGRPVRDLSGRDHNFIRRAPVDQ